MLLGVPDEERGHPLEGEDLVLVDVHVQPRQRPGHDEAGPVRVGRLHHAPDELEGDAELVEDVQRGDALEVRVPPVVLHPNPRSSTETIGNHNSILNPRPQSTGVFC